MFYIVVNVAIAALGYIVLKSITPLTPNPNARLLTVRDIRREFLKAKREGRVEVHDGLSPEFIKKMNRRRWIFRSNSR